VAGTTEIARATSRDRVDDHPAVRRRRVGAARDRHPDRRERRARRVRRRM